MKHFFKIPGPDGTVVSALTVVNLAEVIPASLMMLGRPGGFLVVGDLVCGVAMGCWVVLVTV